jgi:hypothetical protein
MFNKLGIHWASSITAFLALACVPFSFFFYKYGEQIRLKCKHSAEAARVLEKMRNGGAAKQEIKDDKKVESEDEIAPTGPDAIETEIEERKTEEE